MAQPLLQPEDYAAVQAALDGTGLDISGALPLVDELWVHAAQALANALDPETTTELPGFTAVCGMAGWGVYACKTGWFVSDAYDTVEGAWAAARAPQRVAAALRTLYGVGA